MPLTDDELLDFDHNRLMSFDLAEAQRDLEEHGDVFRAQLVAARWVEQWRIGLEEQQRSDILKDNEERYEGIQYALREIAAHLRQGDLIPGGVLYDETWTPHVPRDVE